MKFNLAQKGKKKLCESGTCEQILLIELILLIKDAVEDDLNNINSKYLIPCNSPYPTTLWHFLHSIPFPCFLRMTKGPLHAKR